MQINFEALASELARALETRNYDDFVKQFADDVVFEVPFSVDGPVVLNGIEKVREHFRAVSQSPWQKLIIIDHVTTRHYFSEASQVLTIEYFLEGKNARSGNSFSIQSSVAIVTISEGKIVRYKDFTNTIGISRAAGILSQLGTRLATIES